MHNDKSHLWYVMEYQCTVTLVALMTSVTYINELHHMENLEWDVCRITTDLIIPMKLHNHSTTNFNTGATMADLAVQVMYV